MLDNNEITIVDIKMPFGSMVVFMIKAALAAVPAIIILLMVLGILKLIVTGGEIQL